MADQFAWTDSWTDSWTWTDEELETALNAIVSIELPVVTSQSYIVCYGGISLHAVSADATRKAPFIVS